MGHHKKPKPLKIYPLIHGADKNALKLQELLGIGKTAHVTRLVITMLPDGFATYVAEGVVDTRLIGGKPFEDT